MQYIESLTVSYNSSLAVYRVTNGELLELFLCCI